MISRVMRSIVRWRCSMALMMNLPERSFLAEVVALLLAQLALRDELL